MNNVEKYKDDLEALVKRGRALVDRVMRLANSKKDLTLPPKTVTQASRVLR